MGKYNKEDGVLRPMKSKKWFLRRNKRVIDYFITDTVADDLASAYKELNEPTNDEVVAVVGKVAEQYKAGTTAQGSWISRFKHWLGGK